MKLATLRDGSPDGRLVVVSRDLTRASDARHIAPNLGVALLNWSRVAPELELIARGIETGGQPVERFHERAARAPLPRPAGAAALADPRAPLRAGPAAVALAPAVAAISDGLATGAGRAAAVGAIRLVTLALNGAAGPVAVTPDELGDLWSDGTVAARLRLEIDGSVGELAAPVDLAGRLAEGCAAGGVAVVPLGANVAAESGATLHLEMRDAGGHSIFGAIERSVLAAPATDRLLAHVRAMARNNAWANDRLLEAMAGLDAAAFAAPRTGFFPSLAATLNHSYAVDQYYIDALEEAGRGRAAFAEATAFADPVALRAAQAVSDRRLVALCDRLTAEDLDRSVVTDRGAEGRMTERVDALLAHLFQHQIHHRGQAHAMLAGTEVAPPQLDEFFLDYDRHPSVSERGFLP